VSKASSNLSPHRDSQAGQSLHYAHILTKVAMYAGKDTVADVCKGIGNQLAISVNSNRELSVSYCKMINLY
jgi:hypothetical protein